MSDQFDQLPETLDEKVKKMKERVDEFMSRKPDAPEWFDRELNEKEYEDGPNKFFWAPPLDARFLQTKSAHYCYTYFVDYHRCLTLLGENHKPCKYFQKVYANICPSQWIEKWEEQISKGIFPTRFDR